MSKRIEFYSVGDEWTPAQYRWRTVGNNGEKGTAAEGYTRQRDAYLSAIDWLGIPQRSDLTVPDEADRLALARILHKQHPEVSEQGWAEQLDPEREK